MASGDEYRFATNAPFDVPPLELVAAPLTAPGGGSPHCHLQDTAVHFDTEGWFEVLLEVAWSASSTSGTRFSHTRIPDQQPLHSEAIAAGPLHAISGGRQLLRGNCLFGPDRTTCLILEVWHDADQPVGVDHASLTIRELAVPWTPE